MPGPSTLIQQAGLLSDHRTVEAVVVPPRPLFGTAKMDGDSRTANMGGRTVTGGSLTVTGGAGSSFSAVGSMQAICGNKWLLREGYQHGIGSSDTLAMHYRSQSTSIATTGNPAQAITGNASDANYSSNSDGVATVFSQTGNHIFVLASVNDGSGTQAAYYNNPNTASQTINTMATYLDNAIAAGKIVYLANECPRGRIAFVLESRAVSSGTCTSSQTANFVDGESYGAPGVIGNFGSGKPRYLTKVASAPGQDQYTVSAAGLYTFGGTPPTTAYLTYTAATTPTATSTHNKIMNAWYNSSDAVFIYGATNYGVPGAQYNRPNVRVFDSFNALLDATTGSNQYSLPGTLDSLQLHQTIYGQYLYGMAAKAKIDADYPDAPSLETRPTRNNWYAARGTGQAGTVYSGTLPPTMRVLTPTLVSVNGAVKGVVDLATGNIVGASIVSGSINFATGAWTCTFANSATTVGVNAQVWIEQDLGNEFVGGNGVIGRNAVMNGMMDPTAATGTNLSVTTGVSSVTGVASSAIPYGWTLSSAALNTAIANGTASITVASTTTSDGYPRLMIDVDGIHTAALTLSLSSNSFNSITQKLFAGDLVMGGCRVYEAKHPTINHGYGSTGALITATFVTSAVSRSSPTGNQNCTVLATRHATGASGAQYSDDTLFNATGGATSFYRVTPLLDLSGTVLTSSSLTLTVQTSANVPFAIRQGFGQAQVRRRNDVA